MTLADTVTLRNQHRQLAVEVKFRLSDCAVPKITVENAGLLCERMDRSVYTGDVVETMKQRIRSARLVVADLSDSNPNVYFEIGFAWASGVPTVLLCNSDTDPHFDVRGHRYLRYCTIREAELHLDRELSVLIPQGDRIR